MPKLFVSYRRDDSIDITGRIYDRLKTTFGADAVFMDTDAIPFGVDFRRHLNKFVEESNAVLVVVGPKWFGPRTDGTRRIDDPNDFVRVEVEAALCRDIPVIPVLIGGAPMPGESELPPELKELAFRNAAEVGSGRDFHAHIDRLIHGLQRDLQTRTPETTVADQLTTTAPTYSTPPPGYSENTVLDNTDKSDHRPAIQKLVDEVESNQNVQENDVAFERWRHRVKIVLEKTFDIQVSVHFANATDNYDATTGRRFGCGIGCLEGIMLTLCMGIDYGRSTAERSIAEFISRAEGDDTLQKNELAFERWRQRCATFLEFALDREIAVQFINATTKYMHNTLATRLGAGLGVLDTIDTSE